MIRKPRRGLVILITVFILVLLLRSAQPYSRSAIPPFMVKHRVELFFKDPEELKERVRFLHSRGFSSFNVVNKNQKDTVEEWVKCIHQELPQAHVCAHYSLKYNKVARKGMDEHKAKLQDFISTSQAQEILLITGSGKDLAWNTVKALEAAQGLRAKISVAYNPYFPEPNDQQLEDYRLAQKIKSGSVSKVYLQFGTNLDRLKNALEDLQHRPVTIAGSLFLPTSKLIAQQKFRPWNGVFLSPEFLSGPENAKSIVVEMMKLYDQYNVEMLWEAPGIRTEKDLQVVFDLVEKLGEHKGGKSAKDQKKTDSSITTTRAHENSAETSPTKRSKRVGNGH